MRLRYVALFIVVGLMVGCGGGDSETYKGKPLSDWLKLAKDADPPTRMEALKALGEMKSRSGKEVLMNIVRTSEAREERNLALEGVLSSEGHKRLISDDELLKLLAKMANPSSVYAVDNVRSRAFSSGVFLLSFEPKRAGSLIPLLEQLRTKLSEDDRPAIDDLIRLARDGSEKYYDELGKK